MDIHLFSIREISLPGDYRIQGLRKNDWNFFKQYVGSSDMLGFCIFGWAPDLSLKEKAKQALAYIDEATQRSERVLIFFIDEREFYSTYEVLTKFDGGYFESKRIFTINRCLGTYSMDISVGQRKNTQVEINFHPNTLRNTRTSPGLLQEVFLNSPVLD